MSYLKKIFLLIVLLLSIWSCKEDQKYASETKLDIKNIEDKIKSEKLSYFDLVNLWKMEGLGHFSLNKKIDEFTFTSFYKPYSVLIMEEIENLNVMDTISLEFKEKIKTYENMHFVNFTIQHDKFKNELLKLDAEDNQEYYDRITYYSFEAKNDAFIIEDKDTLKCSFVNFERTYEANPNITLSFAFSRKSKTSNYKTLKFVFEDKIFNKGKLFFNYEVEPITLLNYLNPLN